MDLQGGFGKGTNLHPLTLAKTPSSVKNQYYGGYQKSCMTLGALYIENYGTIVH